MKKVWIPFLFVGGTILVVAVLFLSRFLSLPTIEAADLDMATTIISEEDLKDGCFYVCRTEEASSFQLCPAGTVNWKDNSYVNHTLWFSSTNDKEIPTLYPGDKLVYVSVTQVPYEGIQWERYADYGYSIGVANLVGDNSGHYRIISDTDHGYAGYINPESDACDLEAYVAVEELFLDRIGSVEVRDSFVSAGGTILGLEKDTRYLCEWYTGTYYQDFELTANNHVFCAMESFTTYDYDFLHSTYISISIPAWLKTGYYYVNGVGLFRYVTAEDAADYHGGAYDSNIEWNEPIILYDDAGMVVYDPTSESGADTKTEDNSGTESDISMDIYLPVDESDPGIEEEEEPHG